MLVSGQAPALCVGIAVCLASCGGSGAEPVRGLAAHPPRVKSLSLRLVRPPEPDALIVIRYEPRQHLPSRIQLELDGQRVVVRDDGTEGDAHAGDSEYTGRYRVDVDALRKYQERLDQLSAQVPGGLKYPVFEGRVKLRSVPVGRFDTEQLLAGQSVAVPLTWVAATAVDIDRSLMITAPSVVADATRTYDPCTGTGTALGRWTFGYLMQQMAGTQDPATFVRHWLDHWPTDQTVNGRIAPARANFKPTLLDPWPRVGPATDAPLDLAKAPFRLLAIVNRIDLAENLVYAPGKGGELRFVFGVVKTQADKTCNAIEATVIFEYDIQRTDCSALRDWAQQWLDLANFPLGSSAYLAALETITESVVKAGKAPTAPNTSALKQLRTNEVAFANLADVNDQKWDMREFHIDSTGALRLSVVAQTPDLSLNETSRLASYINTNATEIENDTKDHPATLPDGTAFLGVHAYMAPFQGGVRGTFWKAPGITSNEARYHFSLSTCNGCHAGETETNATHISPSGGPLSGFLTGIIVPDPVVPTTQREFKDLERRQAALARLSAPCVVLLDVQPIDMVH